MLRRMQSILVVIVGAILWPSTEAAAQGCPADCCPSGYQSYISQRESVSTASFAQNIEGEFAIPASSMTAGVMDVALQRSVKPLVSFLNGYLAQGASAAVKSASKVLGTVTGMLMTVADVTQQPGYPEEARQGLQNLTDMAEGRQAPLMGAEGWSMQDLKELGAID